MSPVIYCAIFFKKNSVINGSKEVVPISIIEIEDLDYFDMNGKGTNVQYGYDDYGNLVSDPYKEITDISYNHLNLPVKITFGSGGKIEYFYACPPYWWDATGVKLKKKVTDGTIITTTDYMDGFQYTNGKLDFFPHAGGYAKAIPSGLGGGTSYTFKYVFSYTDHLGNIRVKYAQNPANGNQIEILEEDHYYPYGLKHIGYNGNHTTWDVTPGGQITLTPVNPFLGDSYKYKYNGKELNEELGLDWYDFGARNYDPSIGRWFGVDNLAEKHFNFSPYTYTANNPVLFVDFDGNDYGILVNRTSNTITVKATYLVSSSNQAAFNKRGSQAYNSKSGSKVFVPGGVKALKQGTSTGLTINFDIQSQVDNSSRGVKHGKVDADTSGTLNSFDTQTSPYRGMEEDNGQTNNDKVDVRDNRVDTSTTTHEIGHSLGVIHSADGGALPAQGININNGLVAEILAGAGIGGNNTNRNTQGDSAPAGDATLLNGSTNQGLEQGQVISARRYNRIVERVERREERQKRRDERRN